MESLLFQSVEFTKRDCFTGGIEGPAFDAQGNLYAAAFKHETSRAIGRVNESGEASLYAVLPEGCMGCGMRIHPKLGLLFIADFAGHNVLQIELSTGEISVLVHEPRMNQPNDLAITSQGVLFASDPNWDASTGQLWRIDPDGGVKLLESGMGTTTGIEVSPDERTLYVNETMERCIWAYDLSGENEIGNKRLLYRFEDNLLDGMRCDASGNLYVTRYGKGCIAVVSPSGELLTEVALHGKNCTNLTFGGTDGRDCYVTVADHGSIERFRTDVPGRCWTMWR